ncbi:hypothetical protein ASD52_11180 [Ensifer sp. Root142]|nr:hypothetical protein ASD52_11180 [Ensifer sp. Root142]
MGSPELVLARQDLVCGLSKDRMALEDAEARPGRKGRLGRGNRRLRIVGRGAGIFPDHVVGVGRIDIGNAITANPFAGNQVLVQCHGTSCEKMNRVALIMRDKGDRFTY